MSAPPSPHRPQVSAPAPCPIPAGPPANPAPSRCSNSARLRPADNPHSSDTDPAQRSTDEKHFRVSVGVAVAPASLGSAESVPPATAALDIAAPQLTYLSPNSPSRHALAESRSSPTEPRLLPTVASQSSPTPNTVPSATFAPARTCAPATARPKARFAAARH